MNKTNQVRFVKVKLYWSAFKKKLFDRAQKWFRGMKWLTVGGHCVASPGFGPNVDHCQTMFAVQWDISGSTGFRAMLYWTFNQYFWQWPPVIFVWVSYSTVRLRVARHNHKELAPRLWGHRFKFQECLISIVWTKTLVIICQWLINYYIFWGVISLWLNSPKSLLL